MSTNEETKYMNSAEETQTSGTLNGEEQVENKKQDNGWKAVTIGGVSGVLMGAGALYAANAYAANGEADAPAEIGSVRTNPDSGIQVAQVSDDMSFGEAFATAREAAGPGSVFHWHGNVYNTYYAEEWNSMSTAERNAFARTAMPEITGQSGAASASVHTPNVDVTVNVHDHTNHENHQQTHGNHHGGDHELQVADNVNDNMSFNQAFAAARAEVGAGGVFHWRGGVYNTYYKNEWDNMSRAEKNEFAQQVKPELKEHPIHQRELADNHQDQDHHQDQNDIHEASDITEDGDVRLIGQTEMDGHQVNIYDIDGDGGEDVAIVDMDDTGDLTPPDMVITSEGDVYTGDGELIGNAYETGSTDQMDDSAGSNLHLASNENPEVAPDMPDYMPDADITLA